MRKLEYLLAGVLAVSPFLFAQQSTTSNNQNASPGTQSGTQKTEKSKLTADQKAELKDLRMRAKDACKADKKSESCKTARQDLRAKMNEYGVKPHERWHHKATTATGSKAKSPS
jgi:Spy/CpxP family protein refolding chaperone